MLIAASYLEKMIQANFYQLLIMYQINMEYKMKYENEKHMN